MKIQTALFSMAVLACSAFAEVSYDQSSNTLFIDNCSVTPKTLAVTDKINEWGKVKKDQDGNFVIDANLNIRNNATFTISQCIVTVTGDVVVMPYWLSGISPERNWRTAKVQKNRLEILKDGVLKLASDKYFYIGCDPKNEKRIQKGGEFCIDGGKLTAADKKWGGNNKIMLYPGAVSVLKNSVIEKFSGCFYGIWPDTVIENCTFTDGDDVIIARHDNVVGCTFRNLRRAVLDYGSLNAKLYRCKFENNHQNFVLRFSYGVDLIDCEIKPGKRDDLFQLPKINKKGEQIVPTLRIFKTVNGKQEQISVRSAAKK